MTKYGFIDPIESVEEEECPLCGKSPMDCTCPACEICGVVGDPRCVEEHGLDISLEPRMHSAGAGVVMKKRRVVVTPYFKWFDLWVGAYIDRPKQTIYIQPIPMVGLKIFFWIAQRAICPECDREVQKTAHFAGDGWALGFECDDCLHYEELEAWPFGDNDVKGIDLERMGYRVE